MKGDNRRVPEKLCTWQSANHIAHVVKREKKAGTEANTAGSVKE
jgi:hypothetical protein